MNLNHQHKEMRDAVAQGQADIAEIRKTFVLRESEKYFGTDTVFLLRMLIDEAGARTLRRGYVARKSA